MYNTYVYSQFWYNCPYIHHFQCMHDEKHNLWLIVHLVQQSMLFVYGLVKDDVCPCATCTDCCTMYSNGTWSGRWWWWWLYVVAAYCSGLRWYSSWPLHLHLFWCFLTTSTLCNSSRDSCHQLHLVLEVCFIPTIGANTSLALCSGDLC